MFEDLVKNDVSSFLYKVVEEIQTGEYKPKPDDSLHLKLYAWLQRNSLSSLLQTENS